MSIVKSATQVKLNGTESCTLLTRLVESLLYSVVQNNSVVELKCILEVALSRLRLHWISH